MSKHRPRPPQQRGGALLELMVGLTIGLMVALAALVSVSHTRRAASTQDADIALHQDAATVWRVLGLHLRQAGARRLQAVAGSGDVAFNTGFKPFAESVSASPIKRDASASAAPDNISIAFDGDTLVHSANCLGTVGELEYVQSTFELVNGSLRCVSVTTRRTDNKGGTEPVGPTRGGLIEGVQDFQLRYIQRVGNDLRDLATPTDWTAVVAVEACLHLVGDSTGEVSTDTLDCAGAPVRFTDGRLHKVFRRSFQLRNQNR